MIYRLEFHDSWKIDKELLLEKKGNEKETVNFLDKRDEKDKRRAREMHSLHSFTQSFSEKVEAKMNNFEKSQN